MKIKMLLIVNLIALLLMGCKCPNIEARHRIVGHWHRMENARESNNFLFLSNGIWVSVLTSKDEERTISRSGKYVLNGNRISLTRPEGGILSSDMTTPVEGEFTFINKNTLLLGKDRFERISPFKSTCSKKE